MSSTNNQPQRKSSLLEKLKQNKQTILSGSLGAVFGAGTGLASAQVAIASENNGEIEPIIDDDIIVIPEDISNVAPADVAMGVGDQMTYGQAFSAARQEVGEGGVFVWNGNLYNTYYKEEWDAMSPEDKQEYWASVEAATNDINEFIEQESGFTIEVDPPGPEQDIIIEPDDSDIVVLPIDGGDGNYEEENFPEPDIDPGPISSNDFDPNANIGEWV
jgi:hypothetical protein